MFTKIEGDDAVLFKGGIYRVCPLFRDHNHRLFAKVHSGFVALRASGETSVIGMTISEICSEESLFVSKVGNLYTSPGEDRVPLGFSQAKRLLAVGKN